MNQAQPIAGRQTTNQEQDLLYLFSSQYILDEFGKLAQPNDTTTGSIGDSKAEKNEG